MKKIIIVLPDFQKIGAQRVALDFGVKLAQLGYDVQWMSGNKSIVTTEIHHQSIKYFDAKIFLKIRGLRVLEKFYKLMILMLSSKGATIISVTPLLNRFLCLYVLLGVISSKLIIEDHAYPPRSYLDEFPGILKRIFFKRTEWLYKYASIIRVLTLGTHEYYREAVPSANVVMFPNLMDFGRISRLLNEQKCIESYDFVYIGRFETQKNVPYLIYTLCDYLKLNNKKLLIIGYGSIENEIKNIINELDLAKNVKLKSSGSDNYEYLRRAKVFPLVSIWEGYPLVLIEAMYLGVAVVSFDCMTGPKELIGSESDRGWLVPEGDSEKFINAIKEAVENKKLREEKITKAKKFVTSSLDIDIKFMDYIKIFIEENRK